MWFGLILIVLLIFLSIWGAFLGSAGAWKLFNSLPLAVFWFSLVIAMGVGLVGLRKRSDRLSLQLIHLGCVLVVAAAMYGSQTGHNIRESIFGTGEIRKGMMLLHQGQL